MNVNPQAKVVLCFGDSNTRGSRPDNGERYSSNIRWTGQLQSRLGDDFSVIEEGLGGRTTDLEHPDPAKPSRDGFAYFTPCIQSHYPYNLVIIMLGTNDLKVVYDRSAKEVAKSLSKYCEAVNEYNPSAQILLVSPAYIVMPEPSTYYDQGSDRKSRELASEIKRIANEKQVHFFDAAGVAELGEDGLHWDAESHNRFAESIEKIVRKII